ncbi:MAG: CYTH domain-containing protein [Parcubacteria group bacterium]
MYEVEIKSLLGSQAKCDELKANIARIDPNAQIIERSSQLNHYFINGNLKKLKKHLIKYATDQQLERLDEIIKGGGSTSVRTRKRNNTVSLVIKASIDDTTSANGIRRIELEVNILDLTLDELDKTLLDAGFTYQAKWSREREEYKVKDCNICIDKNAGYGYLAEFEKMVENENETESATGELRKLMTELKAIELEQDRLERMFAHYNDNWEDYYGTDKIFIIE